jgi:predicted Zn-dependent protease
LARHRGLAGDFSGGIDLLRQLLDRDRTDVDVLGMLADLYGKAGRRPEMLEALEDLQKIAPDADRQQQLARLYGEAGDTRRQAEALAMLVDRFQGGDVADRLQLARLQMQFSQHASALDTLERMVARHPKSLDASVVAAQVSAQLAAGDFSGGFERAQRWLDAHPDAGATDAPMLAGALSVGGRPDLAARLLAPFLVADFVLQAEARSSSLMASRLAPLVTVDPVEPVIAATWVQAKSDAGQLGEALDYIDAVFEFRSADAALQQLRLELARALGRPDRADAALQQLRLELALALGKPDSALAAARMLGLSHLASQTVVRLAALALSREYLSGLHWLRGSVEPVIGQHSPALAARMAIMLGDHSAAARWAESAASAAENGSVAEPLQIVRLLERAGQHASALRVLRQVAPEAISQDLLIEYARLHVGLGRPDQGLAAIDALRRTQPQVAWDQAWALMATASQRYDEVGSWLQLSASATADPHVLRDIYHLAMDNKAHAVAVAAGHRLFGRQGSSDRDRLLLANALMAAGRPADAATHLLILHRRGKTDDEALAAALVEAWKQGAPVTAELRQLYTQRLAQHRNTPALEADIAILLGLGAYDEALPVLEQLSIAEPQRWLSAYIETAEKAGQPRRPSAVLARVADTATLPASLRAQVGFRLLDAGDKAAAERTFRTLAATTGPQDPATRRLLHLWGPRPNPAQLDWIEARAVGASGSDRASWMRLLTERGAAARAVAVYDKTSFPTPGGDDVLEAYADAIASTGDGKLLARTLQVIGPRAQSPRLLNRLAQLAAATGDLALERRLWQAALDAGSTDPTVHRALGLLAYRARDLRSAEHHLGAFHQQDAGDVATNRAMGEIRLLRQDMAAAQHSFQQALALLDRSPTNGFASRSMRATLLHRLQRSAEARQLYRQLIAERPDDENLRADYAAMLLDIGDARSAKALLEPR